MSGDGQLMDVKMEKKERKRKQRKEEKSMDGDSNEIAGKKKEVEVFSLS